ncbi:MAG: Crp/Fnr family transcriptional regulator [Actinomycetota bacterium]|nr:Crp/Fnr family transcriptional regulator [Actinomycetota bacterium]
MEALEEFVSHAKKENLKRLKEMFSPMKMRRGQIVFLEGDTADNMYLVESGVVEANVIHSDGKPYIFQFLFEGDIFGEGVAYNQEHYPFSAEIRKDATLLRIPKSNLLSIVEEDEKLQNFLIGVIGRKLDFSYMKAKCIAGERVEKRVACILLKTINQNGLYEDCPERVDTPLTNRDISGLIGSTEETVSRIMSRLKREGIITIEQRQMMILKREELISFLE